MPKLFQARTRVDSTVMFLAACGMTILLVQSVKADDVANIAVSGNKSSVGMLRTYYAEIEQTQTVKGHEYKRTGRYWRTPTTIRAVEQTRPGVMTDVTIKGSSQYVVAVNNGKVSGKDDIEFGALITALNRRTLETDPWEIGLHVLPLGLITKPPKAIFSLEEAVRKGTVRESGWVTDEKIRMVRILLDCDAGERTYEVWIDPAVNWMIRRCVQTMRESGAITWKNEYRVDDFRELKPSCFVPVKCSANLEFKDGTIIKSSYSLTNIKLNERLPDEPPSSIPSAGTRAFDELAGTTYIIDKDARKASNATSIGSEFSPASSVAPSEDPLAPSSGRMWFGLTAISLAVVAVAIGFFIRRRARRLD